MSAWWVNHKQTYKAELSGGYIWSPTKNNDGKFNQGYKNLTLAEVGDIIFSYADMQIKAIGAIQATYKESPVPAEFGNTGDQWNKDGYLVEVNWEELEVPFKPKLHIGEIKDLLPTKYSPIQKTGNGNQGIYLTKIGDALTEKLIQLINKDNIYVRPDIEYISIAAEEDEEQSKIEKSSLSPREKNRLIKARLGQGTFKNNVCNIEKGCRITQINDIRFLIASHIKPWSKSDNMEKLDGNNGLLLSPHADKLFDQGWISFSDDGEMIIAKAVPRNLMLKWGINIQNVGSFNKKQMAYLDYHRTHKFKDKNLI